MGRIYLLAGGLAVCSGLFGCANSWDTLTSQNFKKDPFNTLFKKEDPLHTLRTSPEGGTRAAAMTRLQEPIRHGGSQAEQDEVVEQILTPAATSDPSPVVRAAAIDALGRFQDPRAPKILIAAYHQAGGRPQEPKPITPATNSASPIQQTAGGKQPGEPGSLGSRFGLFGPTGFPSDTISMLRARTLDSLARTEQPEAVEFLTQIALKPQGKDPADRDARLAAVRALGSMNQPGAVPALAKVLQAESTGDAALAGRAHAGLVSITGKDLPPDPEEWNQVIQASYQTGATGEPKK